MKKHRRMLILVTKLLLGHSMQFVEKFAEDFAEYRNGTANLHPSIIQAFQRFEKHFGTAFKFRKVINTNHEMRTGIFGDTLLGVLRNLERDNPTKLEITKREFTDLSDAPKKTYYPISRTLH